MSLNDLRALISAERGKDDHTIETWNRLIDHIQELEARMSKKRKGGKKC